MSKIALDKVSIDKLQPSRSLIDLQGFSKNSLDSTLIGFDFVSVLDDIIFVEFVDEGESSNEIVRNGIVVPLNADSKAWRIGRVVLCGKGTSLVKEGDYVCFPNNMGINISNIEVEGYGKVKTGQFLNEHRIFGIVKPRNDSIKRKSKNTSK